MRASFGGLRVIMLIFVVSTSLPLFKNPIRAIPSVILIAIVGSAIPRLMPASRKSIAEIRAGDARGRARHRLRSK